jgi:thiamine transport system substrate-binding protein
VVPRRRPWGAGEPEIIPVEPDLDNASAGNLTLAHPHKRFFLRGFSMNGKRAFALIACAAMAAPTLLAAPRLLRVLTHSSFAVTRSLVDAFEKANDATVQFSAGGDAGETLNKAILSRANPLADVLYGVDNTFLSRALQADIFQPYAPAGLSTVPASLRADPSNRLVPVDFGSITLNYDRAWFSKKGIAVPRTLEDLVLPAYKGLLVVENPATSSPGLAFLAATISRFGEKGPVTWQSWWASMRKNDVLVVNGWEDAYYNEFSAGGRGSRPLVVSYASSPAYELYAAADPKPAEPPTGNVIPEGGAFLQVEFAGILKGAKEPELAKRFMDFLLSAPFQSDVPLQMWMYPALPAATVPDFFSRFAQIPPAPARMDPALIEARREAWINEWTRIVLR